MLAVFTKQRSSASKTTAVTLMDVTARIPDCAGQPAGAVSAYTQVKMEDAPSLLKIPKSDCPDVWIPLPRHKWPKSWVKKALLNETCMDTHLLASCGKDNLWRFYWDLDGHKTELGMSICGSETRIVLVGKRG